MRESYLNAYRRVTPVLWCAKTVCEHSCSKQCMLIPAAKKTKKKQKNYNVVTKDHSKEFLQKLVEVQDEYSL